jgi:GTP-binding protein HflX
MEAVDRILGELGVAHRPTVLALNKIDRMDHAPALDALVSRRDGVGISAVTGQGLPDLLKAIDRVLPTSGTLTLRIPHNDGAALALCYAHGRVLARVDEPDHVVVDVELPQAWTGSVAPYRVLN